MSDYGLMGIFQFLIKKTHLYLTILHLVTQLILWRAGGVSPDTELALPSSGGEDSLLQSPHLSDCVLVSCPQSIVRHRDLPSPVPGLEHPHGGHGGGGGAGGGDGGGGVGVIDGR